MDISQEDLHRQLAVLKQKHRDLDAVIARLEQSADRDQLQLQRLKKEKLSLKDEIARIEDRIIPDIIA